MQDEQQWKSMETVWRSSIFWRYSYQFHRAIVQYLWLMWFRVLGQQIWPRIGFLAEDLEGRTLSFQIPHGLKRFDLLLVAGCGFKDPVEAFRLLDRSGSLVKTSKTPRFENFSVPLQRTPTTKERLFACGRSYPTSRCQNPQAWMWWLNMWIRAPVQMVTFVFFTMSGSVIEWYWCHICNPEGCVVQALLWGDVICLSSTFHQNMLRTLQQIGNRRSVSSDSFERSVGSILVYILKTRVDAFLKWHVGLRLNRSSWTSWRDFQTWLDIWGSFGMM